MRMAMKAGASTYLIADIDRGGVFGSVYGTIALLRPEERALMKGVIINKFRGDASLFEEGRSLLKELTGIPVVGVIPWFRDIKIEEEDSVALDMKNNTYKDGKINVAIILLKRMSNFTDFDVLEMDPRFNPYYTNNMTHITRLITHIVPFIDLYPNHSFFLDTYYKSIHPLYFLVTIIPLLGSIRLALY